MSSHPKKLRQELMASMMMAGRENGTHSLLFQQTVGQILGLNATDMKCLDVISRSGPASPTQLAKLTGLTTGAVTVLIDRLEKAKLIERKPDPDDRRRTVLVPTREAMKKVPPLYDSMAHSMMELASTYSQKELELLEGFFKKTTQIFKSETEKLLTNGGKPKKKGSRPAPLHTCLPNRS